MTPALETLAPETGLAKSFGVIPPPADGVPLWRVLVDIGLGGDVREADYPLAHVGAYDVQRRGALERAAGEAVERYALAQSGSAATRRSLLGMRAESIDFWWPRWLDQEESEQRTWPWYEGRAGGDGHPVLVPAPAIDYDGGLRHREAAAGAQAAFDASPSGTAAGLDHESATRSALLETIERDAVLCAWAARAGVWRLGDETVSDVATRRLMGDAARLGLRPVFGAIATTVPGIDVVCCVIIDSSGSAPLTAFGSKASSSRDTARRAALQEALQIHELLRNLSTQCDRPPAFAEPSPSLVVDDVARAWWWTTEAGASSMERWIAGWRRDPSPPRTEAAAAEPSYASLVAGIAQDGGAPIIVDLTDRLNLAVRELGWRVVKVVCPGYQQLRMDETVSASLDPQRILLWARNRGHSVDPFALCDLPHPLI